MILMSLVLGYLTAILVGVILGALGAGGAILAVPALVYFFHVPVNQSTHLSLGIVGLVSLVGVVSSWNKGLIRFRLAIEFFLPSSLGVLLARVFIVPRIPQRYEFLLMVAFAGLMLLAARAILGASRQLQGTGRSRLSFLLNSFFVGGVTGLLGAGGGFLIVPILILWAGVSFHVAAQTSLVVIFLNSLVGFLGGWNSHVVERIPVLLSFIGFSVFGLWLSRAFTSRVEPEKMKRVFAYFLVAVAAFTLIGLKNLSNP